MMEESIQFAKKYLEDILSFFGLNTDVYATASDDVVIELHVPSTHLNGFLIGQRGETLRSLQFLVSSALKNQNYEITRVSIDVADYKKQRADRVAEQAEDWVKRVQESGEPFELRPMNPADRRTVHRVAVEHGLISDSVGEGRDRHIVLKPGQAQPEPEPTEPEDVSEPETSETEVKTEPEATEAEVAEPTEPEAETEEETTPK